MVNGADVAFYALAAVVNDALPVGVAVAVVAAVAAAAVAAVVVAEVVGVAGDFVLV